MRYVPVSEARNALPSMIESSERVTLTRNGRPVSVLLSFDDYRSVQALLSLVADDPNRLALILERHSAVQRGEVDDFVEMEEINEERSIREDPVSSGGNE